MTTHLIGIAAPTLNARLDEDRVDTAARHVYEAEITLHNARQSHIDAWVTAAYDRLHEAILEHATAVAEQAVHRSARVRRRTTR